ncbi:unnamed protein product [Xyrichtys novacula]|uniref:Unnamed protein product n=1 Tax=Xyrichtys novacula TaxID=13765 RepID=A0AAV1H246_XYRNO|nr:unnamed protein product [Xyrichtys novacula]
MGILSVNRYSCRDSLIAIKLTDAGTWGPMAPESSGALSWTKCPSGQGQAGSVYQAAVPQTQGPSDKMSQDITEGLAPSSRAQAGIPPEHGGNSSLWNAGI